MWQFRSELEYKGSFTEIRYTYESKFYVIQFSDCKKFAKRNITFGEKVSSQSKLISFVPVETIMTVAVSFHSESYHSNQVLSIFSTSISEICFYSHAMNHSL